MSHRITLSFLWIPPDLGGHSSGPYSGMRTQIRWQRYLKESLQGSRDVQSELLAFDPLTSKGMAVCTFASPDAIPVEWLKEGELVELLNGSRVLAVGKIVRT